MRNTLRSIKRPKPGNQGYSFPWGMALFCLLAILVPFYFYEQLNLFRVFDIPLGFLILAQGIPVIFCVALWFFARGKRKIDIAADEGEQSW